MKLIATKAMLFGGRDLKVGDEFEANDRDARVLKAIRKAEDVGETVQPIQDSPRDPLDHDGDGKKGGSVKDAKYKRRDMQAED